MIVERWTWVAKRGRKRDFIEWCKKLREQEFNKGLTVRVYSTVFGMRANVIMEFVYESEEHRLKRWDAIDWTPKVFEFISKMDDMVEAAGHTRELLKLE